MNKAILFLTLLLVSAFSFGCSPEGKVLKPTAYQSDDPNQINFRPATYYTECGTFIMDYPSDFLGPLPAGHGRAGADINSLCAPAIGDPDPTETADTDGGLNKAKRLGDPDDPYKGDPTDVDLGDPTADD